MNAENKIPQLKESTLPPMKFVCELPKSTNPVADFSWSDPSVELVHLGPLIDKYLQSNPFMFQAEAIPKILQGKDLLITAGTGSGKTEIFLFAILELLLQGKITSAIIFYPSKQLIQNQEARLATYLTWIQTELGKRITYSSYTGDFSQKAVVGIERACPEILLATFDKVFHRIVRNQKSSNNDSQQSTTTANKQRFFEHLTSAGVVVFDEIHVYSGLLLSNVYNYVQVHKAMNPTCRMLLSSATIAEAASFRDDFLPSAEIISGVPHRGTIQVLTLDKSYFDQFNCYIQEELLRNKKTTGKDRQVLVFNDSISENEALTYTIKQKLAEATGIKLQEITDSNQNKIACIHSQLPPERKQVIVRKAEENQFKYLISTELLAQGLNLPGFYIGIQIGWPITGLTGALQRIGRLRFDNDLSEIRYFIFVFNAENEQDGYFLAYPQKLAQKLLEAKLPPLIFSRDNFRITQGFLLLAIAYGITHLDELTSLYCNTIPDQITQEKMNRTMRQAITLLVANGILTITDNYLNIGLYAELTLFLRNYSLRAIPPKWSVKKQQEKDSLFTIDARKVLREALPGNLLINDGRFWSVKTIDQRRKAIVVEEMLIHQNSLDVSKIGKNKCFSPEFSFGRFTQELLLQKMTIQYGDIQIVQKPSVINSYNPMTGFLPIDLKNNHLKVSSETVFTDKSTGLVISFPENILQDVLKHFYFERFHFLRLIAKVLLLEATRELNISSKELVNSLSWKKGKEAIAIYDLAGPSGNSQKIFLHLEQLLRGIHNKLISCSCSVGCGACFGDLAKIFKYNPKTFLLKWLEKVLN